MGHVIIDGTIAGDKVIKENPQYDQQLGDDGMVELGGIVDGYVYLYQ